MTTRIRSRTTLLVAVLALLAGCGDAPNPQRAVPATDPRSDAVLRADLATARAVLAEAVARYKDDPDAVPLASLESAHDVCSEKLRAVHSAAGLKPDDPNPLPNLNAQQRADRLAALEKFYEAADRLAPERRDSGREALRSPVTATLEPPEAGLSGLEGDIAAAEYVAALLLARVEARQEAPPFAEFAEKIGNVRRHFAALDPADPRTQSERENRLSIFFRIDIGPPLERIRTQRRDDAARVREAEAILAKPAA